MQIAISDHDSHQYGKAAGFKFWVAYTENNVERTTWIDFADFADWLVSAGEFDGYDDTDDEGELWRNSSDFGRADSWTFDQVISEFMLTGDLDEELRKFIGVKMIIEDLVLEANAA